MTDFQAWAVELCTLLDVIEANADDEAAVNKLCAMRHVIAEKHGLEVVFGGPQENTVQ